MISKLGNRAKALIFGVTQGRRVRGELGDVPGPGGAGAWAAGGRGKAERWEGAHWVTLEAGVRSMGCVLRRAKGKTAEGFYMRK